MSYADATRLLEHEAQALLYRLSQVRPFALTLPMVAAATPSVAAQAAIESFLATRRRHLRTLVQSFLAWIGSPAGARATPEEAQRRYTSLRLRFLTVITHFDIFADALAERSQHGYGELLGGLDVAAQDALRLPDDPYIAPPVICHLDRGAGAAIRRVRTRLPGGGAAPVAIIRVPRERLVGSGIVSSLAHEVGHQGAALLDVLGPLGDALERRAAHATADRPAWLCYQRWVSEIVADFWSVARVGIASTLGLIAVVSLPAPFVVRLNLTDPHPTPWVRVKISTGIGKVLFPDPQWDRLADLWESLYPLHGLDAARLRFFRQIEATIPEFASLLLGVRPGALGGETLISAFPLADRTPARLRSVFPRNKADELKLAGLSPMVAFAAVGQAKHDGRISASDESRILTRLLRAWALRSTIDASEACANTPRRSAFALVT